MSVHGDKAESGTGIDAGAGTGAATGGSIDLGEGAAAAGAQRLPLAVLSSLAVVFLCVANTAMEGGARIAMMVAGVLCVVGCAAALGAEVARAKKRGNGS
ncbi:hypothetical protein [Streptomyces sp. NPDC097619]|uniref:hypothetical protein n=1 Tax=Streptomyces sp. NPDC097619 TaxID=3157228 RepID=UPI003331420B